MEDSDLKKFVEKTKPSATTKPLDTNLSAPTTGISDQELERLRSDLAAATSSISRSSNPHGSTTGVLFVDDDNHDSDDNDRDRGIAMRSCSCGGCSCLLIIASLWCW